MALASAQKGTLLRRGPNLVSGLRYRCGLGFYFARGRYCKSEGVRNRRARHQHGEYIVPRTVALEGKVDPDDVAADGLHFADRRAEMLWRAPPVCSLRRTEGPQAYGLCP